jgi:ketosteroid isomerase-like protein
MSEENVATLRRAYVDWAEGHLKPGSEIYAPDVVFHAIAEGRETFDKKGFERFMRDFLEQWDDFRMEAIDFEDAGDKVLVTERQSATGKRSGIEMEQINYAVWTFREGLVTEVRWELDQALAREAAGLTS